MKTLIALLIAVLVVLMGGLAFGHFGIFNVAADEPHWGLTSRFLEWGRERSIAARADDIEVPDLENPDLLLSGGPDYNEMCTGCHLNPGAPDGELAQGLYPQPPNLSKPAEHRHHSSLDADPKAAAARQFWIIKHGLKMTGMPAWGLTHDDARIWAMVAFLQKLPTLSPEQYQILTARAEGEEGHSHGAGESMPGMDMGAGDSDGHGDHAHGATDSPMTPQAAVQAFHAAMKAGDAEKAQGLLLPDLQVYEGGGAERSRAEYAKAHMPGDMAYMKDADVQMLKSQVKEVGDAAWVISESRIRGTDSKGKPFDVLSTETAVLRRADGQWRIAHLHWSSHRYGESH